tara:strand:- start:562 stop:690 length:129 start_codon:yes stop_codon:yes gene_type:complete
VGLCLPLESLIRVRGKCRGRVKVRVRVRIRVRVRVPGAIVEE